jgi:hypothetical protein
MFLLKAHEQSTEESKAAIVRRVMVLEDTINTQAMRKSKNPGSYSIPVDEKEGTILDIKMDGNTSQNYFLLLTITLLML